jgi:hypothetical protein
LTPGDHSHDDQAIPASFEQDNGAGQAGPPQTASSALTTVDSAAEVGAAMSSHALYISELEDELKDAYTRANAFEKGFKQLLQMYHAVVNKYQHLNTKNLSELQRIRADIRKQGKQIDELERAEAAASKKRSASRSFDGDDGDERSSSHPSRRRLV